MINLEKNQTSFKRRIFTILCFFPLLFLFLTHEVHAQYDVNVNTMVRQPVSPYLMSLANTQGDLNMTGYTDDIVDNLTVILTNTSNQQKAVKLHARIERIAPAPMGISVKESYQAQHPILLGPNQTLQLTPDIISEAFGRFSKNDLVFENTSLSELRSSSINYKLPEGQYRICVTAYDFHQPGQSMPLSVPGTGCANFSICYSAAAPQFVMPVSSMGSFNQDFEEITPQTSQVQFTWTPSITTCGLPMGALNYDLEIREIYLGQLKADALHNPPVFEKRNIPTTTFLLDTIRYPNVLVKDREYIVRVRANMMHSPNSPLVIDNDGYSEIIGIIYKPENLIDGTDLISVTEEEAPEEAADLLSRKIKGKVSWVFRKSEEKYEKTNSRKIASNLSPMRGLGVSSDNFKQSPVNYYMGNDLLLQNNYTALTQVDPTLNIHDGFVTDYAMIPLDYAIGEVDESDSYDKPTTVSSSRANSIHYENDNVGTTKGSEKHPLEGATVQLKVAKTSIGNDKLVDTPIFMSDNPIYMGGRTTDAWADIISEEPGINVPEIKAPGVKAPQPNSVPIPRNRGGIQANIRGPNPSHPPVESASIYEANAQQNITEEKWDVIATGITDANGNFNLEFLNEEFLENVVGKKLKISINHPGFYSFSYEIPQSKVNETLQEINIGAFTLVANSFRFTPSVKDVLMENNISAMDNLKIDIYRESNVFNSNEFLKYEGNTNVGQSRETKSFNGKQYYKVSTVSIGENQESLKSFDFGKLFAYKDFVIEISSEESGLQSLTTDLRVNTTDNLKSDIVHVYAEYEQTFEPPAVEGRVVLFSDDNEVPVENAVVRVSYNQKDVESESSTASGIFINNPVTPQFDFSIINTDGFTGVNPYESTIPAINGTTWPMTTFSHQPSNNTNNSSTQVPSSTTYKYVPLEVTYLGEDIRPGMQDVMFGGGLLANGLGTTATTDESGYFYIGNLPKLKQGANYTLTLVSVPSAYDDLPVDPVDKKMEFSIAPGITPFKQFKLTPEVTPLIGKVVDEEGEAITNAKLHFEKSNSYFETDQSGVFQTTYFPGTHTLIVEKNGYVKKEGIIEIESNAVKVNRPLVQELVTVGSTEAGEPLTENDFPSYVGIVNSTISGANLLPSGITSPFTLFSPSYDFFGGSEAESSSTVSEVIDIGEIGYLERKRAKIQFVVKDKGTNEPIEGVNIHVFDTINTTNANGEWLYEGFGGNTIVTMTPPKDSKYVAIKNEVEFPANNELVEEVFYLEEGVKAYGKATIAGATQAIDSVRIRIDDKEYISTFTNDEGEYQFYVPKGEHTIKASKIGYISAQATHEFVEDDMKIDFELEDGGGLNINQLLGFAIELEEAQKNDDGSQTWTGEFVGLDFYLPIIELDNETNLKFTDIKVTFDDDGNAIPESNQVAINKSSLNAKLFEYIPLEFSNEEENQIVVKKDENGSWGSISGHIKLDPFRIISHEITRDMLESFAPTIMPDKVANVLDGSTPGSIEFFMGEGADRFPSLGSENENAFKEWLEENNVPIGSIEEEVANIQNLRSQLEDLKFYFSLAFNDPVEINIYDFDLIVDAEKSWIGKDGLNLAGQINTPKIGPLDPLEIPIEELTFDTSFELKKLTAEVKNIPALKFGDVLHAHVNQLQISENGISTGGVVTLKLPSSEPSYLKLNNLRISKNGISGGKFDFSLDGLEEEIKQRAKTAANDLRQNIEQEISVFGAAVIRDNGSNISFGQVSNTGAYYLSGGVNMKFAKYIKKEVKINNFMVSTDGNFSLDVPTNYAADFGFAGFNLNGIEVRYIQNLPALRLDGGFDINLNIISFDASGLTFQANQSGGMDVKIDKIGATLDIPAIAANVELEVGTNDAGDQGFSGNGGFEIPGTNFGADFAFRYYKGINSIDVGAEFAVGATIPIVAGVVSLTRVGGGFYYEKNQNQYKTTIKIISGVGITGVDNIYKIDPLELEVQTGTASKPVIKGTGDLTVVNSINMAEASIVLDLNEKNFSIEIKGKFEPIKAVSGSGTGLARVSWKKDLYIFLGVQSSYKIAGLFDAYGDFALGYNIKPAVRRQSDITGYFRTIDEDLLGGNDTFSGAFVSAGTSFSAGPYEGSIWIASVSAGFGYSADAFVFLNFPSSQPSQATLNISLGGEVNGSANVKALGLELIGANVSACFRITGGYDNSMGWNLSGKVAALAEARILSSPRSCNSINWKYKIVPVGAKVCGHANLSVGYQQRGSHSGLKLSGGFGRNADGRSISCN